jgi:hypothetical protein
MEALDTLPTRMDALESQIVRLRDEIRVGFSAVRDESQAGHKETQRQMRVRHEDLVMRIKVLGEGRRTSRRKPTS